MPRALLTGTLPVCRATRVRTPLVTKRAVPQKELPSSRHAPGSARSSRLGPGGRRALLREDNFSTAPAPGALPTPLQPRSTAPRPEAEPNSLPAARAPPAEAPDPQLRLAPGCGLGPGGGSAPAAPAPPRHAAAVGSRRPLPALGLRGLREARRRPGAARWAAC